MASATDLKTYATSTTDFYALLSLSPTFTQHDLDRAWRRTALKYHPDKVGASDTAAAEKFHLAQIGYDILSDPTIKALYDNARTAREQKERARKMFEGERKRMREELEGREGKAGIGVAGVKRGREEEDFERTLRRLAEDGKRRRREREEGLRREMRAEEEERMKAMNGIGAVEGSTSNGASTQTQGPAPVPELDRSVKVRWVPTPSGPGASIDKEKLATLFTRFGKVESAFILKTKTQRIGPSREKKQVATGVVVFTSVVGAHAAIEDTKKQVGDEWDTIESVGWAANKEPDFVTSISHNGSPVPSTPSRKNVGNFLSGGTPDSPAPSSAREETNGVENGATNGDRLRKVPSFASFSSAAFSTPKGSPFGKAGSPSLEEITMIRLKEAEKRRLEAEIRKTDEEVAR